MSVRISHCFGHYPSRQCFSILECFPEIPGLAGIAPPAVLKYHPAFRAADDEGDVPPFIVTTSQPIQLQRTQLRNDQGVVPHRYLGNEFVLHPKIGAIAGVPDICRAGAVRVTHLLPMQLRRQMPVYTGNERGLRLPGHGVPARVRPAWRNRRCHASRHDGSDCRSTTG